MGRLAGAQGPGRAPGEDTCGPGRTPTRRTIRGPGSGIISRRVMSTTRHQSQADPDADQSAPKLHVVTFGCQMNKYDSELVEGRFKREGYVTTTGMGEADVVLFNTCSVRDHAEERTWSWVGELKRVKEQRPDLVVGVMGCMAQRVEEEIFKRAGHVDLVAGTRQFHLLPKLVAELHERRARPTASPGGSASSSRRTWPRTSWWTARARQFAGGRHADLAVHARVRPELHLLHRPDHPWSGRARADRLVREARWYAEQGVQVARCSARRSTATARTWGARAGGGDAPGPQGAAERRSAEVRGSGRWRGRAHPADHPAPSYVAGLRGGDPRLRQGRGPFLPLPAQAGATTTARFA